MKTFQRILVATDFSPASMPAFEQAVGLAKDSGAELLITHAFRDMGPPESGYAPAKGYDQWRSDARSAAERKLEPLVAQARARGINARPLALPGFPDEAIPEAAAREGADLIVLGTHGRRGAELFFLGSVASRVVTSATCPVMTVRPPREALDAVNSR